jgi:hypothetical protein
VRDHLGRLGASELWTGELVKLWRARLRFPLQCPRELIADGTQWKRPFTVPQIVVEANGLRPLGPRLQDALASAAFKYVRTAEATRDPSADRTRDSMELVEATLHALAVWGETQDPLERPDWPSALRARPRRGSPYDRMYADWLERWRARQGSSESDA